MYEYVRMCSPAYILPTSLKPPSYFPTPPTLSSLFPPFAYFFPVCLLQCIYHEDYYNCPDFDPKSSEHGGGGALPLAKIYAG